MLTENTHIQGEKLHEALASCGIICNSYQGPFIATSGEQMAAAQELLVEQGFGLSRAVVTEEYCYQVFNRDEGEAVRLTLYPVRPDELFYALMFYVDGELKQFLPGPGMLPTVVGTKSGGAVLMKHAFRRQHGETLSIWMPVFHGTSLVEFV
ncbi:MAG: hypothetical protein JWN33_280 [Candidatus Saccharibacteria bacterium]|nr:hypothetical protein [Candidatus Saccharibacteria bacterium]